MSKRAGSFKIPFDSQGNMLGYDKDHRAQLWRENTPFYAKFKFDHFERGRSAAHAIFLEDRSGRRFQMFMTDLSDAMVHIRQGFLEGDFVFAKRGSNYGLKLIREASAPELIASEL